MEDTEYSVLVFLSLGCSSALSVKDFDLFLDYTLLKYQNWVSEGPNNGFQRIICCNSEIGDGIKLIFNVKFKIESLLCLPFIF